MFPWQFPSHRPLRAGTDDDASHARRLAQSGALEIDELRARVDRLEQGCRAMWTLLKRTTGATDEALRKVMEEIDLETVHETERASGEYSLVCESCGKRVSRMQKACIYCGGNVAPPPNFTPLS